MDGICGCQILKGVGNKYSVVFAVAGILVMDYIQDSLDLTPSLFAGNFVYLCKGDDRDEVVANSDVVGREFGRV